MIIPSPLCRYCFTSHNDCSVFSQTFCYHGSWKVAPLCEQWLPFPPNRLTFSTPKHTKQICCKTWYDIIAVSGWVPLTNFTRHIFTCQSTSYGMNLDWASCLNEPTMFCFAYGNQAQGMKRCQLHLFQSLCMCNFPSFKPLCLFFLFCLKIISRLLVHIEVHLRTKQPRNPSLKLESWRNKWWRQKNSPSKEWLTHSLHHHSYQKSSFSTLHFVYKQQLFTFTLFFISYENLISLLLDIFSYLWKLSGYLWLRQTKLSFFPQKLMTLKKWIAFDSMAGLSRLNENHKVRDWGTSQPTLQLTMAMRVRSGQREGKPLGDGGGSFWGRFFSPLQEHVSPIPVFLPWILRYFKHWLE